MGAYDSRFTGQFDITPPLSWAEIRDSKSPGLQDLRLGLDEDTINSETGRTTIITATVVLPLTASPYNGMAIQAELQSLLDAHPTHEFTGVITAQTEDPTGGQFRFVIRDRRVIRQVPVAEWQDEPNPA